MSKMVPSYYPDGINLYVPACQFASEIDQGSMLTQVSLGTPILADVDIIVDGQSMATAGTLILDYDVDTDFGRLLTAVSNHSSASSVISLYGEDYLGQPIYEDVTLNGTNSVPSVKAFDHVSLLEWETEVAYTVDIGVSDFIGLPYKTTAVVSEEADGVNQSLGTFTAPVLTDPATATTGDPRGVYNPTATLDGTKEITVTLRTSNSVNASGNGGLYGIQHYYP
jgi:hypothetical protein